MFGIYVYPCVMCDLNLQITPFYIVIGEEFYRNTGAVHWTVSCSAVMDGIGKIRIGDAIWPVADLVVAILISVATLGAGASLSGKLLKCHFYQSILLQCLSHTRFPVGQMAASQALSFASGPLMALMSTSELSKIV